MLVLRLKPVGKKKQISFRVTVGEKRSKLNGKVLEDLGFYNPHTDKFSLKTERVKYWLSNGAQTSDTVHNVLVNAGVIEGPKIKIKLRKSKKGAEAVAEVKSEAPVAPVASAESVVEKVSEESVAPVIEEAPTA
jgi:small subunit ribosomal protein S16